MSDSRPKVAVIGASLDRSKYGNKAVRAFVDQGWEVFPVHPTLTEIEGLRAFPDLAAIPEARLDRVSLYVPPEIRIGVLDQSLRETVAEVGLNPGTESPAPLERAEAPGLNVIQACSILAIGEHPGKY